MAWRRRAAPAGLCRRGNAVGGAAARAGGGALPAPGDAGWQDHVRFDDELRRCRLGIRPHWLSLRSPGLVEWAAVAGHAGRVSRCGDAGGNSLWRAGL